MRNGMGNFFLSASAALGFCAVAIGAFAAHGLKGKLDEYFMGVFRTGVEYHFYHVFALAFVGLLLQRAELPLLRASGYCFFFGILIFSGSLYCLALTQVRWLGAITPIGGLSFLAGWFLLFYSLSKGV